MGTDIKNLNIGELIKQKIKEQKLTYAELARKINCDRTTIYNITNKRSIDIERLLLISKALKFDFIKHCYCQGNNESYEIEQHGNTINISIPIKNLANITNNEDITIKINILHDK